LWTHVVTGLTRRILGPAVLVVDAADQEQSQGATLMNGMGTTGRLAGLAIAILAGGCLAGCSGGQGEACNSGGILGPLYCDPGLICNEADNFTCEQPGSRRQNQSCNTSSLCASGLWCKYPVKACVPFLHEGDPCSDPESCGPGLGCVRDPAMGSTTVCGMVPDASVTIAGATVIGTVTLPASAPPGAKSAVSIYAAPFPDAGVPVALGGFAWNGGTSADYQVAGVPAGTYFVYALVKVVAAGGATPVAGDYYGWYGGDTSGNPPAAANAIVPESGTVRFDFSLVLR
jgi:hypothetical protein